MFKLSLILAVLLPAAIMASEEHLEIFQCDKGGPMPSWLAIKGCYSYGCIIYNGEPLLMTGELVASYDAKELTTSLRAYIGIIGLDQELPEEIVNGCNSVKGGCPVAKGETRQIEAVFTVDSVLSNISPFIELTIVNEDKTVVMCVRVKVTLQ